MKLMAILVLVLAVILFVHATLLMKLRFNTLRRLLDFIEKERYNLRENDYKHLMNRYSGITRLFEPFPDKESYSVLYSSEDFESFIKKAKKLNKYYLLMTLGGFITLAAMAFWLDSNPM